ncbi:MAG: FmdB family transcriptional regulator [Actinomycetota bacterium]
MPTYVYKFVETGETIEVQQSFTDDSLTEYAHPESGEVLAVKKVFQPVGVTFKGSGFFKTDNRAGSGSGSSNGSGDSSSSGSGSSDSSGSGDSGSGSSSGSNGSSGSSTSGSSSGSSGSSSGSGSSGD